MIEFNVNDYIHVKLTPFGRDVHRKDHEDCWRAIGLRVPELTDKYPYIPPTYDTEGWCKFQGWQLMKIFGPHMRLGGPNPFETTIRLEVKGEPE